MKAPLRSLLLMLAAITTSALADSPTPGPMTMTHTSTRTDLKPVLFVLTSHATKGSTGQSTGYYLGEVTHPLSELEQAGIPVAFASIQGGEPPVDGLDLT